MEKWTGTIKFYNQKKKYGFIKYLYDDKEIFFHISDVYSGDREIYKGCVVAFLTSEDQNTKRIKATNITIVADGNVETVKKLDKHITRIIEVAESIQPNRLTILTGSNGNGKSFIRKLMNSKMGEKFPDRDARHLVTEVSMQKRTDVNNPLIGTGFGFIFFDKPQFPTSISTYNLIDKLLYNCVDSEKKIDKSYIIIDEPEIGMADESQLGIALFLKNKMSEILENSLGIMIITHSKFVVRELKDNADFLYTDYDMTADEWLERKIIPTDFEDLRIQSMDLMRRLNDWLK
ncbi:cold shock domain-containing protein [Lachnospiraceae bacterium MD308]|nr:cold shock domain-containing protein [Lachnospiraceae bacterium MD308]